MAFFNQFMNNARAMFGGNGELDLTGYHDVPVGSSDMFVDEVHSGLKNLWYNLTGQTEKTSAYRTQIAREDSAYQRLANDLQAAGLSKFTVGSASPQTGSYGSGAPQMLTMLGAIADIKKANAESRKINAEAVSTENENSVFDESHAAEIAETVSRTALNDARTALTNIEGQYAAEKITAEIAQLTADTTLAWSKNLIAQKDLEWSEEEHRSSVASKDSGVMLNNARKEEIRKQIEVYSQQISESIARENNLNESSKKLVEDTVIQTLMAQIMAYDFVYSTENGMRYKDTGDSLLGINPAQISEILSSFIGGSGARNLVNTMKLVL